MFLTTEAVNKDLRKQKKTLFFSENHGHNVLRLLDILANFFLTTSETKCEVINMVYKCCITSCKTT